jgi:hypothetical protein
VTIFGLDFAQTQMRVRFGRLVAQIRVRFGRLVAQIRVRFGRLVAADEHLSILTIGWLFAYFPIVFPAFFQGVLRKAATVASVSPRTL